MIKLKKYGDGHFLRDFFYNGKPREMYSKAIRKQQNLLLKISKISKITQDGLVP